MIVTELSLRLNPQFALQKLGSLKVFLPFFCNDMGIFAAWYHGVAMSAACAFGCLAVLCQVDAFEVAF